MVKAHNYEYGNIFTMEIFVKQDITQHKCSTENNWLEHIVTGLYHGINTTV